MIQVAQSYNGTIAGVAFVWMILVLLLAAAAIGFLWKRRRWISARPLKTMAGLAALWITHLLVGGFTIRQILMFRESIEIEMSMEEATKELLLLMKGCGVFLLIPTCILVCLSCLALGVLLRREEAFKSIASDRA